MHSPGHFTGMFINLERMPAIWRSFRSDTGPDNQDGSFKVDREFDSKLYQRSTGDPELNALNL